MAMIKPSGENSRFTHQSSLAILPAETSGSEYVEWTKEWRIFCISISDTSTDLIHAA
jgi:hypothetical protein